MTTEKDQVTEQATAEQGTETDAPEQQEPTLEERLTTVIDDRMGKFQGQQAQVTGQRLKDIKGELSGEVRSAIREMLQEQQDNAAQEQAYIRTLQEQGLDEDQIRGVVQANAARQVAAPKPEPVQQQQEEFRDGHSWNVDERRALGSRVGALLDGLNLADVDVSDQRLWQGLTAGMTTEDAYAVARKNAASLKPEPRSTEQSTTTQQTTQTEETPPPSTQGAPAGTAQAYDSKSDAAQAFAKGEINIDEYKEALQSL